MYPKDKDKESGRCFHKYVYRAARSGAAERYRCVCVWTWRISVERVYVLTVDSQSKVVMGTSM